MQHILLRRTGDQDGVTIRNQGNGIFSKYRIKNKCQLAVQISGGNNPDFDDEGRDYIEAEIDVNSTLLTVATTHMSYTNRFEESSKRAAEDEMLLKHIGNNPL